MDDELIGLVGEKGGQEPSKCIGFIAEHHSAMRHVFVVPRQYNFVHEDQITLQHIPLKDNLQPVYDDSESALQIFYDVLHGRRWSLILTVKLPLPEIRGVQMEVHGLKAEGDGYYSGMTYDLRKGGARDMSHHRVVFHFTEKMGSVTIIPVGSDGLTLNISEQN